MKPALEGKKMLEILQTTLSQQLTVLRNEGLVMTRREGAHLLCDSR